MTVAMQIVRNQIVSLPHYLDAGSRMIQETRFEHCLLLGPASILLANGGTFARNQSTAGLLVLDEGQPPPQGVVYFVGVDVVDSWLSDIGIVVLYDQAPAFHGGFRQGSREDLGPEFQGPA